jgi:hypothetical protein
MRRVAQSALGDQPALGELPDEDLIAAAAHGDRERLRSGTAIRVQAVSVLALIAVGCWLVLVLGRIPGAGYAGIGLGAAACALAVPVALGRAALSPAAAWGNPVRGRCPLCGRRTLREVRAVHREAVHRKAVHQQAPGTGPRILYGAVTLCLADGCAHTVVHKVRQLSQPVGPGG